MKCSFSIRFFFLVTAVQNQPELITLLKKWLGVNDDVMFFTRTAGKTNTCRKYVSTTHMPHSQIGTCTGAEVV